MISLNSTDYNNNINLAAKLNNNLSAINSKLKTGKSKVFIDAYYTNVNQDVVDICIANDLALEVWTVNDYNAVLNLHPYVTGVSSDLYNAGNILKEEEINKIPTE